MIIIRKIDFKYLKHLKHQIKSDFINLNKKIKSFSNLFQTIHFIVH